MFCCYFGAEIFECLLKNIFDRVDIQFIIVSVFSFVFQSLKNSFEKNDAF